MGRNPVHRDYLFSTHPQVDILVGQYDVVIPFIGIICFLLLVIWTNQTDLGSHNPVHRDYLFATNGQGTISIVNGEKS